MTGPVRRSPLAHREAVEAPDGLLTLAERPFDAKVVLRVDPSVAGDKVVEALGLEWPAPVRFTAADDVRMAWQSPDEFLLIGREGAELDLHRKLSEALAGVHHQAVDVTDYHTTIAIAGPKARELLMKLSTFDFHPRSFAAGQVVGTTFGHAQGWLMQTVADDAEDGPAFDLIVRWSMADYLFCLLAQAGREWGMPAQTPVGGEKLVV